MKGSTRVSVLAAVSLSVPSVGAAQAPVGASCRAADAMLRELAVPALEARAEADVLWNRVEVARKSYEQAEGEAKALVRRMDDSADSLVSVLLSPTVADSLRSDRTWLGLSGSPRPDSDSAARRDSLARADSLMDDRVRLHVGSAVADSMAAARDSFYAASDRDVEAWRRGDEGRNQDAFEGSRWADLFDRSYALRDSLRARAVSGAIRAAIEADSVIGRRVLAPLFEALTRALEREDSLRIQLYGEDSLFDRWERADSLANLAEFELERDAFELGGYARSVSIAVEFRGAAAGCGSCPALTAVGDAWRLVDDQLPADVESWPTDRGWWTDPESWFRRVAGRSWNVFMSAVMEAAECFR
ncbi:MAG: hypothetical protein OXT63_14240 [Gemmatimonadota bacterium]|nr:hypothetical protein [Gemmatimonadota bacterium]